MAHVAIRGGVLRALAAASLTVACHHAEPPPPAAEAPAEESSARPAPASELHTAVFDLVMKPGGPVVAGQPATVVIAVDARGGYHVNDRYPYKFKPSEATGLTYASPAFSTEATKLEEKRATMTVSFTPDGKGDRTVAGKFAFSLCSADQCLIEKRDLALSVAVN
ncbi:MAG TPA: hypothetical protein VH062_16015 [Polyangiaceae bacterium]|jgi:hypothetical protein|nr:hypothetical protein [Polyangiaceae bacterium]